MTKSRSSKIFWIVTLVIALVDVVFVYMNYQLSKSAFNSHLAKEAETLNLNFETLMSQTYSNMLAMATYVAGDKRVQELFLQGKKAVEAEGGAGGGTQTAIVREELKQLVSPNWTDVQSQFKARQMHFHLGPGSTSYLRVHKPTKFGDNMDNVRFTIVDTNKEKTPRVGFETGRVYSGLRGVVPVHAFDSEAQEKVHVGALEVGTSFDVVLDIIDQNSNYGAGVLLTADHIKSAMWTDAIEKKFGDQSLQCKCVVEASSRDGFESIIEVGRAKGIRFRDGGNGVIEVDGNNYLIAYQPLRDYLGVRDPSREDVGAVVFWKDANDEVAKLHTSQTYNIIYGVIGFLIIECLFFIALKLGTRRLQKVIDEDAKELTVLKNRLIDAQKLAQLGSWEWDIESGDLWCSDEIYNLLGASKADSQITQQSFLSAIHPDDRMDVETSIGKALKGEREFSIEHRIILPNGTEKTVHQTGDVIFGGNNLALRMQGVVHDITALKVAETATLAKEKIYRQMFELNSAIKLLIDPLNGQIIEANQSACNFYGYTHNELLELSIFEINILNKDQIRHEMSVAEQEKRLFFRFKHRLANGDIRDVEVHSGPVDVEGRHLLHSIIIDVTDRNLYERKLLESTEQLRVERTKLGRSEQKYRSLFESVSVGIVLQNRLGEITAANAKASKILQISQEQLVAKTSFDPRWQSIHVDGSPFKGEEHPAMVALATGLAQENVVMGLKYPDETVWISINSLPLFDSGAVEPYSVISSFSDITDRVKLEQALKLSDNRNQLAQKFYGMGVWEWNKETDEVFCSDTMLEMWGVSRKEFNNELRAVSRLIHPDDYEKWKMNVGQIIATEKQHEIRFRIIRPDGMERWIYALGNCVLDGTQTTVGMIGVCTDVTEQREQQIKLERAASVFSHAQEGIIITDPDGVIVETNNAFHDITGYDEDEVIGETPRILKSGKHTEEFYARMWSDLVDKGHWEGELWNKSKVGEFFAESLTITAVLDDKGTVTNYVGVFSDITNKKRREEVLEQKANYDELTGLPNRRVLYSALEEKCEKPIERGMALLFVDLDGFKQVNDTSGHHAGDELLIQVSQRLRSQLRPDDIVVRMGGDEFILLVDSINSLQELDSFGARILSVCAQPFELDKGEVISISASIGSVYAAKGAAFEIESLVSEADAAMYRAKAKGKNRCVSEILL